MQRHFGGGSAATERDFDGFDARLTLSRLTIAFTAQGDHARR